MTAPNIDLYLPKTYVFKRAEGIAYASTSMLSRTDGQGANYVYLPLGLSMVTGTGSGNQRLTAGGLDYVYLPQGSSLVQVVATDLKGTTIRVDLTKAGGRAAALAIVPVEAETQRIFTDTFANANAMSSGLWLRFYCTGFTVAHAATGTLGVTITPLQAD